MNLMETAQLLGNFGEFFGSIAVVATLIYIAIQVTQNAKLIENQSHLDSVDQDTKFMSAVSDSSQLSALFVKGQRSMSDLTEEEEFQFTMALSLPLTVLEYHIRRSRDPADAPEAVSWTEQLKFYLDTPGGSEYWSKHRDKYFPEFIKWVESNILIGPTYE